MKVPDSIPKIKDLELFEFMDIVQLILNYGLYQMRVVTAIPDWAANEGEHAIYYSGDIRQLYFQINGMWTSIGFNSLGTLILFDKDGDTGITPEFSTDEDVLRFYISGAYNFGMGSFGFAMPSDTPVVFDGTDGDTKWVYESADGYLKCYVDGTLRMEM